jgi:hypothetical protein
MKVRPRGENSATITIANVKPKMETWLAGKADRIEMWHVWFFLRGTETFYYTIVIGTIEVSGEFSSHNWRPCSR